MVSSLEECEKLRARGVSVEIRREVRYYAAIGKQEYVLAHDWMIQTVEEKIWNSEAAKTKEQPDELPTHASTGLDSFVTRLEKALHSAMPSYPVRVNRRDLHDLLRHFIRLDNEARSAPKRESGLVPGMIPSEAMCDKARGFIMGLDLGCRKWAEMKSHLEAGGYNSIPRINTQAEINPKGHITKWDVAECIFVLMTSKTDIEDQ